MKAISVLCICLLILGCKDKARRTNSAIKKANTLPSNQRVLYKLNEQYEVIDTGQYDTGVSEGHYAIISKGNFKDTINKYFGMKEVPSEGYLYLKLSKNIDLDKIHTRRRNLNKTIGVDEQGYFLIKHGETKNMIKIASDFDSYFSSPNVINGKIYYWQLKQTHPDSAYKVSAAEYDPLTKRTKSYYIKDDYIDTDDSNYFGAPYLKNDTIYFSLNDNKILKFSPSFNLYK